MTPEFLGDRYASIWSSESAVRESELAACLADACSYCDANGLIEGRDALSAYMGGFQQNVKGGNFLRSSRSSTITTECSPSGGCWAPAVPCCRLEEASR